MTCFNSGPLLLVSPSINDMEEGSFLSLPAYPHPHWQVHFFPGIRGSLFHIPSSLISVFMTGTIWLAKVQNKCQQTTHVCLNKCTNIFLYLLDQRPSNCPFIAQKSGYKPFSSWTFDKEASCTVAFQFLPSCL